MQSASETENESVHVNGTECVTASVSGSEWVSGDVRQRTVGTTVIASDDPQVCVRVQRERQGHCVHSQTVG